MRKFTLSAAVGLVLIAVGCTGAEDRQAPSWPSEYTMRADGDIEIQFAYPGTPADWTASVFIHHNPSGSSVGVNQEGFVSTEHFLGEGGRAAICAVLNDESVMEEVRSKAGDIDAYTFMQVPLDDPPCGLLNPLEARQARISTPTPPLSTPTPFPTPWPVATARPDINNWPEKYAIRVNEDVEIQFSIPDELTHHIASVVIRHFPSVSLLGVNQDGFATLDDIGGAEAHAAICAVLNDEALMDTVRARATALNAYTFGQSPLDNLPCESIDRSGSSASSEPGTTVDQGATNEFRVVYDRRDWPADYRRRVGDDVEIQFAYPLEGVVKAVAWTSPIYVWHIPTSGAVSVDIDGRVTNIKRVVKPEAIAAICTVLSDADLMAEVTSRALEINATRLDSRLVEPDPCGGVE